MTIFLSPEHILEEMTFLEELNINRELFIPYMLSCPLVSLDNNMIAMDKETYRWFEELIELFRKAKEAFSQIHLEEFIEQHINAMLNSDFEENWFTAQDDLKRALVDAMNPSFFMVATKTCNEYVNIDRFEEVLLDVESIKQCSFIQLLEHAVGDSEINRLMDVLEDWNEDDQDDEYIIAKKFIKGSLRDKLKYFLQLDTSEDLYVIAHGDEYEFEIKRALERENHSIHLGDGISEEGFGYSEYFYLDNEDRVYYSNLRKQIMKSNLVVEKKANLLNELEWKIVKLINENKFAYDYFSLEGIVDQALEDEEGFEWLREILEGKEVS